MVDKGGKKASSKNNRKGRWNCYCRIKNCDSH